MMTVQKQIHPMTCQCWVCYMIMVEGKYWNQSVTMPVSSSIHLETFPFSTQYHRWKQRYGESTLCRHIYSSHITKNIIEWHTDAEKLQSGKPKLLITNIYILWKIDAATNITTNWTGPRDVTSRTKLASRKSLSANHMIKNQCYRLPESSCSSTGNLPR